MSFKILGYHHNFWKFLENPAYLITTLNTNMHTICVISAKIMFVRFADFLIHEADHSPGR